MAQPTTTSQWTVVPKQGLDGLHLEENVPIPVLADTECLVQIEAVSLNYRDIAIPTGRYPMPFRAHLVPCSDASGTIIATGPKVQLHRIGDRVCTLFNQAHQSGLLTPSIRKTSLGSSLDGVLRRHAVYNESGLVPAPASLSFAECATLPCAALTAWNALTGLSGRALKSGDHVLVQGTGGVSLFAAQFAVALGASVIATTSSASKAAVLRHVGVRDVIDYTATPEWGDVARALTEGGLGVQHVVEVGGETTMAQSLRVVCCEGVISVIGFLGGNADAQHRPGFGDVLQTLAIVRGVNVGSKDQFVEMNAFVEKCGIRPVVDRRVFGFEEAREAFRYMLDAKHEGKIVIDVGGNGGSA